MELNCRLLCDPSAALLPPAWETSKKMVILVYAAMTLSALE